VQVLRFYVFPAPCIIHHTFKVNDNHGLISNYPGVVPCRQQGDIHCLYSISVPSSILNLKGPDTRYWKWGKWLWRRIFILDFAFISQKFPSHPRRFSHENKKISTPPPCGFLIGIYIFYENWSTETFRKSQRRGLVVTPAIVENTSSQKLLICVWKSKGQDRRGLVATPLSGLLGNRKVYAYPRCRVTVIEVC